MTAILSLIYCWLQEFFFSLTDWGLSIWDSLLSVADSTLATIGTAGLTLPVIPDQYAWVLGATGMSQALAIVASAMGTRFILQTIPFVLMIAALLLGILSYGVSLVLDMHALRLLGAAREAGFFATAPFIGALAAVPLLGERWGSHEIAATVVMVLGVGLLLRARHHHIHVHAEVLHDHAHVHEDHHDHEHEGENPSEEPHAHLHGHLPLMHDHPHVSDLHHRHEHG